MASIVCPKSFRDFRETGPWSLNSKSIISVNKIDLDWEEVSDGGREEEEGSEVEVSLTGVDYL